MAPHCALGMMMTIFSPGFEACLVSYSSLHRSHILPLIGTTMLSFWSNLTDITIETKCFGSLLQSFESTWLGWQQWLGTCQASKNSLRWFWQMVQRPHGAVKYSTPTRLNIIQ